MTYQSSRTLLPQSMKFQMQGEDEREADLSSFARINQVAPTQAEEIHTHQKSRAGKFCKHFFLLLFCLHLLLTFILIITLTIRGLVNATHNHKIRPIHWYPPLLTSSLCAAIVAFSWTVAVHRNPAKAIKAAFWLAPSLTFAASLILLSTSTDSGLTTAALGIVFALIQSLYTCWVARRHEYAAHILSLSLSATGNSVGITKYVVIALLASVIYSGFWVSGVGNTSGIRFSAIYVTALIISLAWTMHVIRNILHVAISRVAHTHLTTGTGVDTRVAIHDAVTGMLGSVCQGSALVPVIGLLRGLARTMILFAGDTAEFMFSCAHCYMGVTDRMVRYGNRWGFVHVGVYHKGIVQASGDTWEMFVRVGMVELMDKDLIGSFCFLCGVAGGALCAIVGGSWAYAVDKSYATSVSVCAFFVGYFMNRIAVAWPQACVSAYHVAYAENPRNQRFDSTIPDRIRALQPTQV